jgi:hypothetical protein
MSGEIELPMGPGYVHAVVPHLLRSFKLSAPLEIAGSLMRDEGTAVTARVGRKVSMIPMTVRVEWADSGRRQTFHYRVCRHRDLTMLFAQTLVYESGLAYHDPPTYHTVRYKLAAEYADLGRYEVSNVATGWGFYRTASDLVRPIYAVEYNPYAEPPELESLEVEMTVSRGEIGVMILDLRLDAETYRPGDTVTGSVILRPFRGERVSLPIRFKLPDDLPEGTHALTACDSIAATARRQQEMPHRFDPDTLEELFDAVQRTVELPADRLYLRLPLDSGGLALGQQELPDLPLSRAGIVAQAGKLDTHAFVRSKVERIRTDYVLDGSVTAEFTVRERPREALLRTQEGAGK